MQVRDPERYDIIEEHGRGGLGRVSRAHDRELGRDIAIKELISRDHVHEVRFLREALITARLEHPGIVPIYEAGRWPDGTPFYAMKLVAGRSLRELIAERPTVDDRIGLLHHLIAVADAIAYAHGRNIIHRDLKPANVIVGDFGETIVIDWGIAKDLTARDEAPGAGPFRTPPVGDLTAVGSVLGTPAYMAPEQQRGEPVDQRADVFAIGAMLWELCTLHKTPPSDAGGRQRILRRSGLDKDLATIINKAVDPDPDRRYREAGALAADLKAFKAGARIAARNYSLLAMLAHWTRRHRALALSLAAALAISVTGSILYVSNIASERDRADAARQRAEATQGELILKQAELLLRVDPTAAFDALATYHGRDPLRPAMLRAQARGLGLATMRAVPHTDSVLLARALPDGSVLTLGYDKTIAKTTAQGQVRVIARDVARGFAYAEPGTQLAYGCASSAICLLDVTTERQLPVAPDMSSFAPARLAFSPNGQLLAAAAADGRTAVWRLADGARPALQSSASLPVARELLFVDEQTLVVASVDRAYIYRLEPQRPLAATSSLAIEGVTHLAAGAVRHQLAIATARGAVVLGDVRTGSFSEEVSLCRSAINGIAFLHHDDLLGYACQDGDVGIWDVDRRSPSPLTRMDGGSATATSGSGGRYLLVGGNSGKLLVYDIETRLITTYLGHAARFFDGALSSGASGVVSGDAGGALRSWPLPRTSARAILQSPARLVAAILVSNHGPVVASRTSSVAMIELDGKTGQLEGHDPVHIKVARSASGNFALYAQDDIVELWDPAEHHLRALKTEHGTVTAARYVSGDRLVTAGSDGRVVEWSVAGDAHRELAAIGEAIAFIVPLSGTGELALLAASGSLWHLDSAGVKLIEKLPGTFFVYAASPDKRHLVVGTTQGTVRLYDTQTWKARTFFSTAASIGGLAYSSSGDNIIAIVDHTVRVLDASTGAELLEPSPHPTFSWQQLDLPAKSVACSSDGNWLAIGSENGAVWLYGIHDDRWLSLPISTGTVFAVQFSEDSRHLLTSDSAGQATLLSMESILDD